MCPGQPRGSAREDCRLQIRGVERVAGADKLYKGAPRTFRSWYLMATDIEDMTNLVGKDVFTTKGAYCGKARDIEIDLPKFKVRAVVVDAAQGSYLADKVGGKKGVIVPYSMVSAVDDVIMIKHFTGQVRSGEEEAGDEYEKEQVEEAAL